MVRTEHLPDGRAGCSGFRVWGSRAFSKVPFGFEVILHGVSLGPL